MFVYMNHYTPACQTAYSEPKRYILEHSSCDNVKALIVPGANY
jgi:hypothetical protein